MFNSFIGHAVRCRSILVRFVRWAGAEDLVRHGQPLHAAPRDPGGSRKDAHGEVHARVRLLQVHGVYGAYSMVEPWWGSNRCNTQECFFFSATAGRYRLDNIAYRSTMTNRSLVWSGAAAGGVWSRVRNFKIHDLFWLFLFDVPVWF